MALVSNKIKVVTIEKMKMYEEAIKNISNLNLEKRIKVVHADALKVNIEGKFDMIFIDGAKGQYIRFFERFKDNLKKKGVIITDNVNFYGLVDRKRPIVSKSLSSLVDKINNYRDFLNRNQEFTTTIYNVGDGVSVSVRK